jgi:hypothetical protein
MTAERISTNVSFRKMKIYSIYVLVRHRLLNMVRTSVGGNKAIVYIGSVSNRNWISYR